MSDPRRDRLELIARRKHVGLSQERLAELVGVSPGTISLWERGHVEPSPRYRPPLAEALGVDLARIDRLIDPRAPLEISEHLVAHWLNHYDSLIQGAATVCQVATIAVPGLLQTRGYADASERTTHLPASDEEILERVEVRMLRRTVLERSPTPLNYQVLIDESVLRARIGGPAVMAAQLDHLDNQFHAPNIDIRILPCDGRALCARGGFELLTKAGNTTPFLVITVDVDGPRYEERQPLLVDFLAMYEHLLQVALSPADSLACIRRLQRSHQ
jgi:transcriptional regulator with XRE-family HTH domain